MGTPTLHDGLGIISEWSSCIDTDKVEYNICPPKSCYDSNNKQCVAHAEDTPCPTGDLWIHGGGPCSWSSGDHEVDTAEVCGVDHFEWRFDLEAPRCVPTTTDVCANDHYQTASPTFDRPSIECTRKTTCEKPYQSEENDGGWNRDRVCAVAEGCDGVLATPPTKYWDSAASECKPLPTCEPYQELTGHSDMSKGICQIRTDFEGITGGTHYWDADADEGAEYKPFTQCLVYQELVGHSNTKDGSCEKKDDRIGVTHYWDEDLPEGSRMSRITPLKICPAYMVLEGQSETKDGKCSFKDEYRGIELSTHYWDESDEGATEESRYKPISKPCATDTEYEAAAPTETSDRVCADVTKCEAGHQYQTLAPTETSDRVCASRWKLKTSGDPGKWHDENLITRNADEADYEGAKRRCKQALVQMGEIGEDVQVTIVDKTSFAPGCIYVKAYNKAWLNKTRVSEGKCEEYYARCALDVHPEPGLAI